MKWISTLGSRPAALPLVRALIVVLVFLSSRTAAFSSSALCYDGKRPRPSKQSLPTGPIRPAAEPEMDADRKGAPSETPTDAPLCLRGSPVLSPASHLQLRRESTKPPYLQFFRASSVPSPLPPPA